jgi:uncharacterized protein YkwD
MTRFAPLLALLAAAVLAGCGSAGHPGGRASGPGGAPLAPGGSLEVGVTDGRLGGAVTETDSTRARELATARRIDPHVLRPSTVLRDGVAAGDSCANADLAPAGSNLATVAEATLCLLNGERADRGLTALKLDRDLQQAALGHGNDMVDHRYFAHDGRDGSRPADRIRAAGYLRSGGAWRIGENLAWGTGDLATPRAIMAAWMASPGHRANILQPAYREIGFGVIAGNPGSESGAGATYVTEFGVVARPRRTAARRARGGTQQRAQRSREGHVGTRARDRRAKVRRARSKARRARARAALAPRSRRGRVVGRVAAFTGGLG